jgi:hypothetical protein
MDRSRARAWARGPGVGAMSVPSARSRARQPAAGWLRLAAAGRNRVRDLLVANGPAIIEPSSGTRGLARAWHPAVTSGFPGDGSPGRSNTRGGSDQFGRLGMAQVAFRTTGAFPRPARIEPHPFPSRHDTTGRRPRAVPGKRRRPENRQEGQMHRRRGLTGSRRGCSNSSLSTYAPPFPRAALPGASPATSGSGAGIEVAGPRQHHGSELILMCPRLAVPARGTLVAGDEPNAERFGHVRPRSTTGGDFGHEQHERRGGAFGLSRDDQRTSSRDRAVA